MASSSNIHEILSQMQKTLECSICLEMMTNPVSTCCGHQFCRFCLMEFLEGKKQVPCPLCKTPLTKRSLTDREQLGDMVSGVRHLIAAFQKDTGILFSPLRGPQASVQPGTPDAIRDKPSSRQSAARAPKQAVKRSLRQSKDATMTESSTSSTSETSTTTCSTSTTTNNVSMENAGKQLRSTRRQSNKAASDQDKQLELLRCIEEGTHHARQEHGGAMTKGRRNTRKNDVNSSKTKKLTAGDLERNSTNKIEKRIVADPDMEETIAVEKLKPCNSRRNLARIEKRNVTDAKTEPTLEETVAAEKLKPCNSQRNLARIDKRNVADAITDTKLEETVAVEVNYDSHEISESMESTNEDTIEHDVELSETTTVSDLTKGVSNGENSDNEAVDMDHNKENWKACNLLKKSYKDKVIPEVVDDNKENRKSKNSLNKVNEDKAVQEIDGASNIPLETRGSVPLKKKRIFKSRGSPNINNNAMHVTAIAEEKVTSSADESTEFHDEEADEKFNQQNTAVNTDKGQLERIKHDNKADEKSNLQGTVVHTDKGQSETAQLSGSSVAYESENSSGPLFRTPIDVNARRKNAKETTADRKDSVVIVGKTLKSKETENGKDSVAKIQSSSTRSLRSKYKKSDRTNEEEAADDDGGVQLTPELSLEFDRKKSEMQKTYNKRDRESAAKGKIAKQKVSSWLRNIPDVAVGVVDNDLGKAESSGLEPSDSRMTRAAQKKVSKVKEAEALMGQKMRHLAEQVNTKKKDLLFEFEEFVTDVIEVDDDNMIVNAEKDGKFGEFVSDVVEVDEDDNDKQETNVVKKSNHEEKAKKHMEHTVNVASKVTDVDEVEDDKQLVNTADDQHDAKERNQMEHKHLNVVSIVTDGDAVDDDKLVNADDEQQYAAKKRINYTNIVGDVDKETHGDSKAMERSLVNQQDKTTEAIDSVNQEVGSRQEPVNKRRVFKSRTSTATRSGETKLQSEKTTNVHTANGDTNVATGSDNRENEMIVRCKSGVPVYERIADENSPLNISDPYEFKSSQPTPKKSAKGKTKLKRLNNKKKAKYVSVTCSSKATKAAGGKAKGKLNVMSTGNSLKVKEVSNVIVIDELEGPAAEKVVAQALWDKDSKPGKTILKNRIATTAAASKTEKEVTNIANELNQAEDHDLLMCTQDALDRLDKETMDRENKKQEERIAHQQNKKQKNKKQVRFKDFVQPGHIDIKTYRAAKKQCQDEATVGKNTQPSNMQSSNMQSSNIQLSNMQPAGVDCRDEARAGKGMQLPGGERRHPTKAEVNRRHTANTLQPGVDCQDETITHGKGTQPPGIDRKHTANTQPCGGNRRPTVTLQPLQVGAFENEDPTGDMDKDDDEESDDLSEDYRFHDDSSVTDDLDIEADPSQVEQPDLDIQPEEIRTAILSQQPSYKTPQIPVVPDYLEQEDVELIAETPILPNLPGFHRKVAETPMLRSVPDIHGQEQDDIELIAETPMLPSLPDFHKEARNSGSLPRSGKPTSSGPSLERKVTLHRHASNSGCLPQAGKPTSVSSVERQVADNELQTVAETPLIPDAELQQDVDAIQETPALFNVPKFGKTSKKSQRAPAITEKSLAPSHSQTQEDDIDAIQETPALFNVPKFGKTSKKSSRTSDKNQKHRTIAENPLAPNHSKTQEDDIDAIQETPALFGVPKFGKTAKKSSRTSDYEQEGGFEEIAESDETQSPSFNDNLDRIPQAESEQDTARENEEVDTEYDEMEETNTLAVISEEYVSEIVSEEDMIVGRPAASRKRKLFSSKGSKNANLLSSKGSKNANLLSSKGSKNASQLLHGSIEIETTMSTPNTGTQDSESLLTSKPKATVRVIVSDKVDAVVSEVGGEPEVIEIDREDNSGGVAAGVISDNAEGNVSEVGGMTKVIDIDREDSSDEVVEIGTVDLDRPDVEIVETAANSTDRSRQNVEAKTKPADRGGDVQVVETEAKSVDNSGLGRGRNRALERDVTIVETEAKQVDSSPLSRGIGKNQALNKRKRKSFMLDDNEDSLEFGSLDSSDDSPMMNRPKIQRTRGSPRGSKAAHIQKQNEATARESPRDQKEAHSQKQNEAIARGSPRSHKEARSLKENDAATRGSPRGHMVAHSQQQKKARAGHDEVSDAVQGGVSMIKARRNTKVQEKIMERLENQNMKKEITSKMSPDFIPDTAISSTTGTTYSQPGSVSESKPQTSSTSDVSTQQGCGSNQSKGSNGSVSVRDSGNTVNETPSVAGDNTEVDDRTVDESSYSQTKKVSPVDAQDTEADDKNECLVTESVEKSLIYSQSEVSTMDPQSIVVIPETFEVTTSQAEAGNVTEDDDDVGDRNRGKDSENHKNHSRNHTKGILEQKANPSSKGKLSGSFKAFAMERSMGQSSSQEPQSRKNGSQGRQEDRKGNSRKFRHTSGMLVSPNENFSASMDTREDSPEDIFLMDSEMPFVDNSPLEQPIELVKSSFPESEMPCVEDNSPLDQPTELVKGSFPESEILCANSNSPKDEPPVNEIPCADTISPRDEPAELENDEGDTIVESAMDDPDVETMIEDEEDLDDIVEGIEAKKPAMEALGSRKDVIMMIEDDNNEEIWAKKTLGSREDDNNANGRLGNEAVITEPRLFTSQSRKSSRNQKKFSPTIKFKSPVATVVATSAGYKFASLKKKAATREDTPSNDSDVVTPLNMTTAQARYARSGSPLPRTSSKEDNTESRSKITSSLEGYARNASPLPRIIMVTQSDETKSPISSHTPRTQTGSKYGPNLQTGTENSQKIQTGTKYSPKFSPNPSKYTASAKNSPMLAKYNLNPLLNRSPCEANRSPSVTSPHLAKSKYETNNYSPRAGASSPHVGNSKYETHKYSPSIMKYSPSLRSGKANREGNSKGKTVTLVPEIIELKKREDSPVKETCRMVDPIIVDDRTVSSIDESERKPSKEIAGAGSRNRYKMDEHAEDVNGIKGIDNEAVEILDSSDESVELNNDILVLDDVELLNSGMVVPDTLADEHLSEPENGVDGTENYGNRASGNTSDESGAEIINKADKKKPKRLEDIKGESVYVNSHAEHSKNDKVSGVNVITTAVGTESEESDDDIIGNTNEERKNASAKNALISRSKRQISGIKDSKNIESEEFTRRKGGTSKDNETFEQFRSLDSRAGSQTVGQSLDEGIAEVIEDRIAESEMIEEESERLLSKAKGAKYGTDVLDSSGTSTANAAKQTDLLDSSGTSEEFRLDTPSDDEDQEVTFRKFKEILANNEAKKSVKENHRELDEVKITSDMLTNNVAKKSAKENLLDLDEVKKTSEVLTIKLNVAKDCDRENLHDFNGDRMSDTGEQRGAGLSKKRALNDDVSQTNTKYQLCRDSQTGRWERRLIEIPTTSRELNGIAVARNDPTHDNVTHKDAPRSRQIKLRVDSSSDDDDSTLKKALSAIERFNKIKSKCLATDDAGVSSEEECDVGTSSTKNSKERESKDGHRSQGPSDAGASWLAAARSKASAALANNNTWKYQHEHSNTGARSTAKKKDEAEFKTSKSDRSYESRFSTRIDSSDDEIEIMPGSSQIVILESDIDEDDIVNSRVNSNNSANSRNDTAKNIVDSKDNTNSRNDNISGNRRHRKDHGARVISSDSEDDGVSGFVDKRVRKRARTAKGAKGFRSTISSKSDEDMSDDDGDISKSRRNKDITHSGPSDINESRKMARKSTKRAKDFRRIIDSDSGKDESDDDNEANNEMDGSDNEDDDMSRSRTLKRVNRIVSDDSSDRDSNDAEVEEFTKATNDGTVEEFTTATVDSNNEHTTGVNDAAMVNLTRATNDAAVEEFTRAADGLSNEQKEIDKENCITVQPGNGDVEQSDHQKSYDNQECDQLHGAVGKTKNSYDKQQGVTLHGVNGKNSDDKQLGGKLHRPVLVGKRKHGAEGGSLHSMEPDLVVVQDDVAMLVDDESEGSQGDDDLPLDVPLANDSVNLVEDEDVAMETDYGNSESDVAKEEDEVVPLDNVWVKQKEKDVATTNGEAVHTIDSEEDGDSDIEGESMRQLNTTSSSALSSQSENLSSQERLALEKELENLAEERKAIELQLKQHQTLKNKGSPMVVPYSTLDQKVAPVLTEVDLNQANHGAIKTSENHLPTMAKTPIQKKRIAIVVSGLQPPQMQMTRKLAVLNDLKFFSKYNDEVTHVIVNPVEQDEFLCERTLKFFQGLAGKCWVLSYNWVADSREAGYLLPEEPYEIQGDMTYGGQHQGPRRSRLSTKRLFDGIIFLLLGDDKCLSKDCLMQLVQTCGGKVKLEIPGQESRTVDLERSRSLAVSCTDMEDEEAEEQQREIIQISTQLYEDQRVVTVTREWILDSLTIFSKLPLHDYIITECDGVKMPSFK